MNSERNDAGETLGGAVPPNFSDMLDKVLANPEIISTVAAALSKSAVEKGEAAEKSETVAKGVEAENVDTTIKGEAAQRVGAEVNETSSPDVAAMMQRLPDVMKLVGPMMSKGGGGNSLSSKANAKRTCLLSAIKPYLNPHRCEAIDYMIRFSELSELIKKIH